MLKPFTNIYAEQILLIDPMRPIQVYKNLNKNCFSVRQEIVRFHCNNVALENVQFVVNETARLRVVKNKRREVHAYVSGFLSEKIVDSDLLLWYNPYKVSQFQCNGVPVLKGSTCHLTTQKICVTL